MSVAPKGESWRDRAAWRKNIISFSPFNGVVEKVAMSFHKLIQAVCVVWKANKV